MTNYKIDDTFQSFEEVHKFANKIIKGVNNGVEIYLKERQKSLLFCKLNFNWS